MKKTIVTVLYLASLIASAQPTGLPAAVHPAEQLAALDGGFWLAREQHQLRQLDGQGQETGRLAIKSTQLDARGHIAAVVDYGSQQVQLLDARPGQLQRLATLPATRFSVEALCLYRDPQALLHAFLIGEEGQGEQWLLSASPARKVRNLSLPPGVVHCQVDDASRQLLLVEEDFGVWAYPADAERPFQRQAVLLKQPYGKLKGGASQVVALPGGVAVLDQAGLALHLVRYVDQAWQYLRRLPQAHERDGIASLAQGILVRDARTAQWQLSRWPTKAPTKPDTLPIVLPLAQTDPVAKLGDAADDPAIWINPSNRADSRVLGTNKKQGLLVYDLQGKEKQLLAVGRLNNVDIRQQVKLGTQTLDLAVATHRDDLALVVFNIGSNGVVSELGRIPTGQQDIYGVCLYQPKGGGLEAFVNDKDGRFLHYRLAMQDGKLQGHLLREFRTGSQPEGCVAHDAEGVLFFGEEDKGVWTTSARADAPSQARLILPVGQRLQADVEGMALYYGPRHTYLLVSSQGNDSYVVLDAQAPYRYRGAFRVGINLDRGIDAASETDGLDVTSANLGTGWQEGMLVVQDGHKRLPDGPQNFKYVPWSGIAEALKLD
ncbi:phytase [Chitinimonas viridis]|uniref:Phytase n=1 Tax=Chitinimonas viridis TaxID=664880 RepID=A0ABT8B1Z3_9NEIS|nr:phytase [Chitinimonas viridis]MDN3576126.1 phytase [Chitinimonas viridis]